MTESRPQYMTPEGHRSMIAELARLGEERSRVVQGVADAAAEGDRSENAEYIYGKKRLREIDRRMRFLKKTLDAAVVVDPAVDRDFLRRDGGARGRRRQRAHVPARR